MGPSWWILSSGDVEWRLSSEGPLEGGFMLRILGSSTSVLVIKPSFSDTPLEAPADGFFLSCFLLINST